LLLVDSAEEQRKIYSPEREPGSSKEKPIVNKIYVHLLSFEFEHVFINQIIYYKHSRSHVAAYIIR